MVEAVGNDDDFFDLFGQLSIGDERQNTVVNRLRSSFSRPLHEPSLGPEDEEKIDDGGETSSSDESCDSDVNESDSRSARHRYYVAPLCIRASGVVLTASDANVTYVIKGKGGSNRPKQARRFEDRLRIKQIAGCVKSSSMVAGADARLDAVMR
jgi:hypothetical protein